MTPEQAIENEVDYYIAHARKQITRATNYIQWISYEHPRANAFIEELRAEGWQVYYTRGTSLCPKSELWVESREVLDQRMERSKKLDELDRHFNTVSALPDVTYFPLMYAGFLLLLFWLLS
jgi:hypothetical protein